MWTKLKKTPRVQRECLKQERAVKRKMTDMKEGNKDLIKELWVLFIEGNKGSVH